MNIKTLQNKQRLAYSRIILNMARKYLLLLFFLIGILFPLHFVYASCNCPTSSLEVSPQPAQPGQPVKLTFPWDRANNIEDNTTGGLLQEAGHVDNTSGGSIHFQNGSNNWYVFHASTCGTYTWNHQSVPSAGCAVCYTSVKFTVCGTTAPTAQQAPPTSPPLPTVQITDIINPTDIPTRQPSEPTQPPIATVPPTSFTIPTGSSEEEIPTSIPENKTQKKPFVILPQLDTASLIVSTKKVSNYITVQMKTGISAGKDFFMKIVSRFLDETTF